MEPKPQLIIVPDEDYQYGLTHGAYPEFAKELASGDILVTSREKAIAEYGITSPQDNKIYVRNVFDGTFRDITAESTEKSFIEAKAVAIRETLRMMGVYSAELVQRIEHIQDKDLKVGAKGKKGGIGGEGAIHKNTHKGVNINALISLQPFKRTVKSASEIQEYVSTHGLGDVSTIIAWIECIKRDGRIVGKEDIEVSFIEELAVARDAALKLQLVQCEAGFNIESLSKETHSFFEKISIDFGE